MGGFRTKAPVFAGVYLVVLLASIGIPLTSGFPGELLMITGLVKVNLAFAVAGRIGNSDRGGLYAGILQENHDRPAGGIAVLRSEFPGKICVCPHDRFDFFNRDFSNACF